MNHQQAAVLELDRHHLQGNAVRVVAEIDEAGIAVCGTAGRWLLLETQARLLNDVPGALT